ncbi:glycosyl hydrolase family 88 [bacterium 1xD8-48]|nr:glycosyl hydrolase family 88 [Lachnospiraceae bacterium]MCI9325768.1 glycosyl hydrolase family 88 [Lachnospiraceae bacterium]NBJ98787.1 glycosyl hydrolase family 88 [bacterium 1xD8-48]
MGKTEPGNADREWLEGIYQKLLVKMKAECGRVGTKIPYSPKDGRYSDMAEAFPGGIGFWTNGFWPGMLWQMYSATEDEIYKETAEGVEERLAGLLDTFESLDHDIGFLFLPSAVANYRKTGNKDARRRGLHAANILAGRFNPVGKFIRAWNGSVGPVLGEKESSGGMIIDCMMNIPLLYWAAKETGDPRFHHVAVSHAKTAQQYIVREDGSCNHIVVFDPQTGEFLDNPGGQGFEQGSAWSRGQSWAVYGFSLSYRHTGDESFLNTAKRCAHYCISNLAVNGWLPLVDYRAPKEPLKYDSTAGMITACGLLELAEHVGEYEKNLYTTAALNILKACDAKFSNWDPEADSIVDGGTFFYHDPEGKNTEVPIIYADYYFIEALLRLKGEALFIW